MQKSQLTPTRKADWRSVMTLALGLPILVLLLVLLYFRPVEQTALQSAIIATGEYPPFSGEQLKDNGIAAAIVSKAMKEIGYEIEIKFMPWPLATKATAESGTNQGVRAAFPYVKSPEREREFYFSDPILTVETSIFYNPAKTPQISAQTSLADLKDYHLLPIAGYRYLSAVEQLPKLNRVAENNVEAFKQLLNDPDTQLVAEATAVGSQVLSDTFPRQQQQIKFLPAFTSPLYLIASKRNPYSRSLILEFNKALAAIDEDQRREIESAVLTQINEQNQVLLNPFDGTGYLKGYFRAKDSQPVLLPQGTRALVEQWPGAYLNAASEPVSAGAAPEKTTWVKVRILNGPLRQEILYVDGRAVELP